MMVNWIEGIRVDLEITVFRTNHGESVTVRRTMFCTVSSRLQFALDILVHPLLDRRIDLMYILYI